MRNEIYLRRANKVVVKKGENNLDPIYIASVLKNVEALGYTFSEKLIKRLRTLSVNEITDFNKEIITNLKELTGAKNSFNPMYPNFPKQVMEADVAELYVNAILHYLGDLFGVRIMPEYEKEERLALLDRVDLKVIDLGSEQDFKKIAKNLMGSKTSTSETDKKDIEWFIKKYSNRLDTIMPDDIPHKENLAFVAKVLLNNTGRPDLVLGKYFKVATDVLRLAVALSDGDITLATNSKFRNFRRPERRMFLGLIENCKYAVEDMLRNRNKWLRLGEKLHPSEYGFNYPNCAKAFDKIRNHEKEIQTFNGKVESLLAVKDVASVAELLKAHPGDFARRLDHVLRLSPRKDNIVLEAFKSVSTKVSTPVLLQVLTHFKNRCEKVNDLRIFFPKGNITKVQAIDNELKPLKASTCQSVVDICQDALRNKFSSLEELGKVYLDGNLKGYNIPFSQRSASRALKTLVRGSRMPLPEGNTVRFFLWWKEGKMEKGGSTGRVDIDLSATLYNEDFRELDHISYTHLRSSKINACHSGDITSAPRGACEFIDCSINSAINAGVRYILPSIYSFSNQPFYDLPECYAGWMMRQHPQSGEIFDARTVDQKFDLATDTQTCLPVIIDLQEREIVWLDLAMTSRNFYGGRNVESNRTTLALMLQAMTQVAKPNLYDLFRLHAEARGEIIEEIEEADTVFSIDEGITPFDYETIVGEYL